LENDWKTEIEMGGWNKMNVREVNCEDGSWMALAQDCVRLWALV